MPQRLLTQAAKIVIKKEVELPRQLCLVESQATGNGVHLVRLVRGFLNPRNKRNCLLLVLVALLFRLVFVNPKQLGGGEIFLDDDVGVSGDGVIGCRWCRGWRW